MRQLTGSGRGGFYCRTDKSEDCKHVIFSIVCLDVEHPLTQTQTQTKRKEEDEDN
jgi:hypothetical protein